MTHFNNLSVLRRIFTELRHANSSGQLHKSPVAIFVLKQFRKYKVTELQYCKAQEEMFHLAKTYLCYLQSQRKYAEIHGQYHAKGERTVKETADMVGFKLPHDPK